MLFRRRRTRRRSSYDPFLLLINLRVIKSLKMSNFLIALLVCFALVDQSLSFTRKLYAPKETLFSKTLKSAGQKLFLALQAYLVARLGK